jgi:hypothetical protein
MPGRTKVTQSESGSTVLGLAISKPARLYVSRAILEEYSEVLAHPGLRIRKGFASNYDSSLRTTVIPWSLHDVLNSHATPMTIYSWNAPN